MTYDSTKAGVVNRNIYLLSYLFERIRKLLKQRVLVHPRTEYARAWEIPVLMESGNRARSEGGRYKNHSPYATGEAVRLRALARPDLSAQ
jgi:hypothetical protein